MSEPYIDASLDIEKRVEDLLQRLTFEEKCLLSAGESHNSPPAIPRLGIPQFMMTDGPHGVSPYKTGVGPGEVHPEIGEDGAATKFPPGIQMASTWNPALIEQFGKALGEETRAVQRSMILGPAMNICRYSMNGRTFEYYSEDPVLSGTLGASAVKGIQSVRISSCIKHFTANNNESNRFKVDCIIDERTLREIYLRNFEIVVKNANPWSLMSSYNKVNGIYVSEHKEILRKILKEEWGFSGVVVSDWGATKHCTGIKGLVEAGLDIEMGSRVKYQVEEMKKMKENGIFPEKEFDDNIRRILRAMIRVGLFDPKESLPEGKLNTKEHQDLARKIAEEGSILLKNEHKILPIDCKQVKKICILGKHADIVLRRKKLGGGSSLVYPPYEVTIRQGIEKKLKGKVEFVSDPSQADLAIVCVGLEHSHDFKGGDHEGSDRLRYGLGYIQNKLVLNTAKKNPNTIVILVNGQPADLEKIYPKVPVILEAWYGGLELGNAVANILCGEVNPSGKLPVSWIKTKKDMPTALSLLATLIGPKTIIYKEGIFVGYRYFESKNKMDRVRFPFGFGLSYTTFEFSNLKLNSDKITEKSPVSVSFEIKNTGQRDGAEVAQLYVSDKTQTIERPLKELKHFKKEFIKAGETKKIEFTISYKDLCYWDVSKKKWHANPGEYEIAIGSSSQDIKLIAKIIHQ